jgi:cupin 2 domain-containing protein
MKNLLKNIPQSLPDELFETLVKTDTIHIQRIISKGHTTPKEGWYDQNQNLNCPNLQTHFIKVLK